MHRGESQRRDISRSVLGWPDRIQMLRQNLLITRSIENKLSGVETKRQKICQIVYIQSPLSSLSFFFFLQP